MLGINPFCQVPDNRPFEWVMKHHKPKWMPVKEAVKKGLWKPIYVKV